MWSLWAFSNIYLRVELQSRETRKINDQNGVHQPLKHVYCLPTRQQTIQHWSRPETRLWYLCNKWNKIAIIDLLLKAPHLLYLLYFSNLIVCLPFKFLLWTCSLPDVFCIVPLWIHYNLSKNKVLYLQKENRQSCIKKVLIIFLFFYLKQTYNLVLR